MGMGRRQVPACGDVRYAGATVGPRISPLAGSRMTSALVRHSWHNMAYACGWERARATPLI